MARHSLPGRAHAARNAFASPRGEDVQKPPPGPTSARLPPLFALFGHWRLSFVHLAAVALLGVLATGAALSAAAAAEGPSGGPLFSKEPSSRGRPPPTTTPAPLSGPPPSHPSRTAAPVALVAPSAKLRPGQPIDVPIPGDRPLRVAHAAAETTHAIVYLHGMCGTPEGADLFADLATTHGTLITVRADVPCPDRPGFKWPQDVSAIQLRIEAALAAVKEARGGLLDTTLVTLVGYSQGAHRAERLAAAYPQHYRRLALGGPPTSPTPERLRHAHAVAVFGGEREDTTHMVDGYLDLVSAGIDARFFLLPRSGHGTYGPEGRRVVREVFDFLFQAPQGPPHHPAPSGSPASPAP